MCVEETSWDGLDILKEMEIGLDEVYEVRDWRHKGWRGRKQ